MTETTNKVAAVAIIGRPDDEFKSLLFFLRYHPAIHIVGEFKRISEALEAGLAQTMRVDIAIIMQTSSDEYSKEESNQLIGRMLFGRIVCCYGGWCYADGRSHDIWPVSTRMALGSAETLLSMELAAFAEGHLPLSPMSAGEEVFVHRISRTRIGTGRSESAVLIISSERPLRKTIGWILSDTGLETRQIPMAVEAARMAIQNAVIHPRIAIFDLDPPDATAQEILAALYTAFPNLTVLGMTVFPHATFHVGPLQAIIDKTEMSVQLPRQLHRQQEQGRRIS